MLRGLQINGRETEADVKSLGQLAKHVLRGASRLKLAQDPSFAPILLTEVISRLLPNQSRPEHPEGQNGCGCGLCGWAPGKLHCANAEKLHPIPGGLTLCRNWQSCAR